MPEERPLTLTEVHDFLVDLESGCPPDLRPKVVQVRAFLQRRESRHALQELLEAVRDRLADVSAQGEGVRGELNEWRPAVLRAIVAETERAAAAKTDAETRAGVVGWLRSAAGAQTIVMVLVVVLSAFGIRVSLPGGMQAGVVETPTVQSTGVP